MNTRIISATVSFLVATVMISGAYWIQNQSNRKQMEAQQSYIETLEEEIEDLRGTMRQELRAQSQLP